MISAPTAQSKGKYLYYERYYYDVFILAQRQAGVYALVSSGPSLGELSVTSAQGPKSGESVITSVGDQILANGNAVAGTSLKYCVNENSAVSLTYGAVPDATKTWTKLGNPATIGSLTSGKVVTVAQVNDATGFAIAGGHATQVVK